MDDIHNKLIINIAKKHDINSQKVQEILEDYFDAIGVLKSGKGIVKPINVGVDISVNVSANNQDLRKPPLVIGAGISQVQMQKLNDTVEELLNKANIDVSG